MEGRQVSRIKIFNHYLETLLSLLIAAKNSDTTVLTIIQRVLPLCHARR